ncbi:hypothetical protein [Methylopila sp. M107]|uniref:calcium-binding protein n=1 Tax=Methylopila sp. M107 TaxID=1101190 RepID=UPI0003828668|nr:hypothetical protein [Methylopila sp. M107]
MAEIKATGALDFEAYLANFDATFAPMGRGAFSDGLSGDEYVLWSGPSTIPVTGAQAFILESGEDGDLAYDFTTHTVGGTIDAIEFGIGVTENDGDYSTAASVRIEDLGLSSTGAAGIVNQLTLDLMGGNTDVLLGLLKKTNIEFTGSAGDDVFTGFDGKDELNGGKGNDDLSGGKGRDVLNGGKGDDALFGGAGKDTYEFDGKKFGNDVIEGFSAGKGKGDVIQFDDKVFDSFADVLGAAKEKGGNVVITISDTASVTLTGVGLDDLHRNDFIFD